MRRFFWPASLIVIIGALFAVNYLSDGRLWDRVLSWAKLDWKKIEGCVVANESEIKYEFKGKRNWILVTPDMGCGRAYQDAESWGLKDKKISDNTTDVTQFTVLVTEATPSFYDKNKFNYFPITGVENRFIEIGRVTVHDGDKEYGITDGEWEYLKDSFKAK